MSGKKTECGAALPMISTPQSSVQLEACVAEMFVKQLERSTETILPQFELFHLLT